MLDEFDDPTLTVRPPDPPRLVGDPAPAPRMTLARLVSRVYRSASDTLRAEMLSRLLQPLGTLALAAVSSGAFARFLERDGVAPGQVSLDDVANCTSEQIRELALFVYDVNPAVLQQISGLLVDNTAAVTAMSASALVLLYRRLHRESPPR